MPVSKLWSWTPCDQLKGQMALPSFPAIPTCCCAPAGYPGLGKDGKQVRKFVGWDRHSLVSAGKKKEKKKNWNKTSGVKAINEQWLLSKNPLAWVFFCWAHAVQCGISLGLAGVKLCPLPASASPQPTHWESRTGKRESLGAVQASLTAAKTVCCQHCSGHRPPVEHPTDCSQHN